MGIPGPVEYEIAQCHQPLFAEKVALKCRQLDCVPWGMFVVEPWDKSRAETKP